MSFVHGKIFTAEVIARRIVPVICKKCGTNYCYELTRVGVGKGSALYFIGQTGAANRASIAAKKNAERRLRREAEMVPCPKCNWVNQDQIERYRLGTYRRVTWFMVMTMLAGLIAAPALEGWLIETYGHKSQVPRQAMIAVLAFALLSPVWILLIRRQLRQRIDPNVTYPRRPSVPLGTPPALVEQLDPQSGEKRLVLSSPDAVGMSEQQGWVIFRPGQVSFPAICCVCLNVASTYYRTPIQVNERSDVAVPLCKRCLNRLRLRWWLMVLLVAIISVTSGWLLSLAQHGIDSFGRGMCIIVIGLFGTLFGGIVIAGYVCRPYRLIVVDRGRGITKFAARNPGFTALLVEQVRRSYGIGAR